MHVFLIYPFNLWPFAYIVKIPKGWSILLIGMLLILRYLDMKKYFSIDFFYSQKKSLQEKPASLLN